MDLNTRQEYAKYSRYFTKIKEAYTQRVEIRESLELLLSLLTISALVIFALRPTFNTIAELFATLQSQQEVAIKLEEKLTALTRAQQVWAQEQNRIGFIDQSLPSSPQPQSFLKQVEGLTGKHNLTLTVFSAENVVLLGKESAVRAASDIKKGKSGNNLPKTRLMHFSVNIAGPYSQLSSFLEEFEGLRQSLIIENFAMSLTATAKSQDVSLRLTGSVPYFEGEK